MISTYFSRRKIVVQVNRRWPSSSLKKGCIII